MHLLVARPIVNLALLRAVINRPAVAALTSAYLKACRADVLTITVKLRIKHGREVGK